MDKPLIPRYDRASDRLPIALCPPDADQETEELGDRLLARFNPDTNAIKAIKIFGFSKRRQGDRPAHTPTLPICAPRSRRSPRRTVPAEQALSC